MKVYPYGLIGEAVTIAASSNPSLVGVAGAIMDETRHLLRLTTPKGNKIIQKQAVTLTTARGLVLGLALLRRPEDRLKGK